MNPQKSPKKRNNLIRYSAYAFEMALTIILFLFFGKYLDSEFETSSKVYTAILSVIGVIIAIFNIIRRANKS